MGSSLKSNTLVMKPKQINISHIEIPEKIKERFVRILEQNIKDKKGEPLTPEGLYEIVINDPSGRCKYVRWMTDVYKRMESNIFYEDLYKMKESIEIYEKSKFKLEPADRNILNYRTTQDLWDKIKKYKDDGETILTKNQLRGDTIIDGEYHLLYENKEYKIIVPITHRSSCFWGSGTKWCTAVISNKVTYDSKTGEIKDERNHMSMLEDFWIPRRDGTKGTEITTLDGGQNLGQMEDVDYLLKKVYRALNVPISRLDTAQAFNMGRSSEITRDELLFFKFIEKLRKRFSQLFLDLLKKQAILKGILTEDDWNKIYQDIIFVWNHDSHFTELKENEILREKVDMLNIIANYTGQFYSTKWVRKNILKQTDEDILEIDKEIQEEQAKAQEQQILQQQMNPDQAPEDDQQSQDDGQKEL